MIQSLTAKFAVATLGIAGLLVSLALAEPRATVPIAHAGPNQSSTTRVVKTGKYQVELRIPDEGLFASEEVDVEFRVSDTTQKDPIEDGFKGVPNVDATGLVTIVVSWQAPGGAGGAKYRRNRLALLARLRAPRWRCRRGLAACSHSVRVGSGSTCL